MDEPGDDHDKVDRCSAYLFYPFGWIGVALVVFYTGSWQLVIRIVGVAAYLLYFVESYCFSTAQYYLKNVLNEKEFVEYLSHIQTAKPRATFKISCYHYEKRDDKRRTVTTHSATMRYPVKGHIDETLSPVQTLAMFHLLHDGEQDGDLETGENNLKRQNLKSMIVLCRFPLEFHPTSDNVEQHYASTRDEFWEKNTRDQYQDTEEEHSVDGHREYVMVILKGGTDDSTERPWWMHRGPFFLSTLCLMSVPYRLLLYSKCIRTDWTVLKHFSHEPLQDDQDAPKHSRKHRTDAASRAFCAIPRETLGTTGGNGEGLESMGRSGRRADPVQLHVKGEVPKYWKNQDLAAGFDDKIKLPRADIENFQRIVDQTFKAKASRDRQGEPMPTKFVVRQVVRMEDANLWSRYTAKRSSLASLGGLTLVQDLPGSGPPKTAQFMDLSGGEAFFPASVDDFAPEVNETYLFHGSAPGGALGIGEHGFNLGKAGSNVGTMFGAGAYFAEASSKSDEYATADPQGVFAGKQALILCRVLLGNPFYITSPDIPKIEAALATGSYDCVLGDREAAVDTYREFVVFEEAQIYPEYIIIYEREFGESTQL